MRLRWLIVPFLLVALVAPAAAKSCSFGTSTGTSFSNYNVFSASDLSSTGTLSVQCAQNGNSITVTLDRGVVAQSYFPRYMTSGQAHLAYNLYLDATHLQLWGDGTAGTATYAGTAGTQPATITIYGSIPAGQDVAAGTYSDVVTATVQF